MPQTIPITNEQLLEVSSNDEALLRLMLKLWFEPKKRDFFKNNGIRVDSVHKKNNDLLNKYFELENGRVKLSDGEKKEPVLLEGMTKEAYLEEYKAFAIAENSIKV